MAAEQATLYFICGKIASGKTTLARRLATERSAVLICEDEWLVRLGAKIDGFEDFLTHARRLRAAIGPHVIALLRLGTSVVLDVPTAANTPNGRAWMRSLFEAAQAAHELHVIDAPDDVCKARLRVRNETKPEGLYFGSVPEDMFDPVTRLLVPPTEAEGFHVIRHGGRADEPQ
jgi:predicted kinase